MVMQCRLPFCQISGRQGICTISRLGCGGTAVSRHQNRAIDDQMVGIGSRQAASLVDDRLRPGQGVQGVRHAGGRAQGFQFFAHARKFVVVAVRGVRTGLEHDGVIRCEARQRIDVGIGIVAFEVAVIEHEHAARA